jgi:pyruvate/2-oxoglutarate/acetoin dehydrogenase E1 component
MSRIITYVEAVHEALDLKLADDPRVYLIGLGVPDPKGIFGTTLGLQQKYGNTRVMDMPVSENAVTGIVLGSAITGMRPILSHQRVDFALLSLDQIINHIAKWHFMFGGQNSVPLVIRLIIGRGWGQGPQHSQSLESIFAHIPGLKVIMPVMPSDAKGLIISAIEDDNPVIILEHRWLHGVKGEVPEGIYRVPIGKASIVRVGDDLTVVASSYMVLEVVRAAESLYKLGKTTEVIDLRSLRPLDDELIVRSVQKTGKLLVLDTGWGCCGIGSEIVARVCEKAFDALRCSPVRISLPDYPCPTSPSLSQNYYPRAETSIIEAMCNLTGVDLDIHMIEINISSLDVPDAWFTGPF